MNHNKQSSKNVLKKIQVEHDNYISRTKKKKHAKHIHAAKNNKKQ